MASIYDLKPRFQNRLRPWVNVLASAGITANQVTVTATMLSMAGGGFIAMYHQHHWSLLLIPLILFVRMALNAIDGMLAREHDMQTPLGAILNELGDVVSDIALYLPLGLVGGVSGSWIVAIVLLAIVSEMTGVLAAQIGALFARLAALRIVHGDTKATNFLVAGGRVQLIDLDAMKVYTNSVAFARAWRRDTRRFLANWRDDPEILEPMQAAVADSSLTGAPGLRSIR